MLSDVESGHTTSTLKHHDVPQSFLHLSFESYAGPTLRRWRQFLRPHSALKLGVFSTAFVLSSLIVYITFLSPSLLHSDWQAISYFDPNSLQLPDPGETLLLNIRPTSLLPEPTPVLDEPPVPSPSPSPVSDVLTLEQIRDVVAPTRGFFSRDYSLGLGWNNVSAMLLKLKDQLQMIFWTDAVYHRSRSPSGRAAKSYLGFAIVHLRTRVRI